MPTHPAQEAARQDAVSRLPVWLRSVIDLSARPMPVLPYERAARRHPGSLPAPPGSADAAAR